MSAAGAGAAAAADGAVQPTHLFAARCRDLLALVEAGAVESTWTDGNDGSKSPGGTPRKRPAWQPNGIAGESASPREIHTDCTGVVCCILNELRAIDPRCGDALDALLAYAESNRADVNLSVPSKYKNDAENHTYWGPGRGLHPVKVPYAATVYAWFKAGCPDCASVSVLESPNPESLRPGDILAYREDEKDESDDAGNKVGIRFPGHACVVLGVLDVLDDGACWVQVFECTESTRGRGCVRSVLRLRRPDADTVAKHGANTLYGPYVDKGGSPEVRDGKIVGHLWRVGRLCS